MVYFSHVGIFQPRFCTVFMPFLLHFCAVFSIAGAAQATPPSRPLCSPFLRPVQSSRPIVNRAPKSPQKGHKKRGIQAPGIRY